MGQIAFWNLTCTKSFEQKNIVLVVSGSSEFEKQKNFYRELVCVKHWENSFYLKGYEPHSFTKDESLPICVIWKWDHSQKHTKQNTDVCGVPKYWEVEPDYM